jgi:dolichyl-phosphate-mannose--protein O-mannosyl transferase
MSLSDETHNARWPIVWCALLALAAVGRIISSYSLTSQAFDEPCHIAAAIELLARHTYKLDPVHPPLARIAIGLPLYLAGERYPKLSLPDQEITYHDVGNAVLSDSGHYARNLALARLGVLPFFFLATAIVFLWARREYGDLAAAMAAALFTTLPNVLAFSSIAYTDIVAAATQVGLFFAFVQWLDKPTRRSALWLGLAAGLALASKATTVIFFPAAALAIVLGKWICTRTLVGENIPARQIVRHVAIVAALAIVTLWATYGFSVGHVREGMNPLRTPSRRSANFRHR